MEALPYIKSFQGKTVVVKYGGSTLGLSEVVRNICLDMVFLKCVGIHPVLVHGGGPEISQAMKDKGKKAEFVQGLRVTDRETMQITLEVMTRTNAALVDLIVRGGGEAKGVVSGAAGAGRFLSARKKAAKDEKGNPVDIGFVGEVTGVDTGLLRGMHEGGSNIIPVIAPIAVGEDGQLYNVNADHAASEVAVALKAHKLVFLTDVQGIRGAPEGQGPLLSSLHARDVEDLIRQGVASGGMVPKVRACARALAGGVAKTHIIDGRVMHSLLLEVFTDEGIGTEIVQ